MVIALAFHECVLGSITRPAVICGVSLLVFYHVPRGFFSGSPVFHFRQKPLLEFVLL